MTSPTANPVSRVWVLYDGRAELEDTEDCSILEAFSSRKDLRNGLWNWKGHDGVLFEYDLEGGTMVNERRIGHLREGINALKKRTAGAE